MSKKLKKHMLLVLFVLLLTAGLFLLWKKQYSFDFLLRYYKNYPIKSEILPSYRVFLSAEKDAPRVSDFVTNNSFDYMYPGGFNFTDGVLFSDFHDSYDAYCLKEETHNTVLPLAIWRERSDLPSDYSGVSAGEYAFVAKPLREAVDNPRLWIVRWPIALWASEEVRNDLQYQAEEIHYRLHERASLLDLSYGIVEIEAGYLYSFFVSWEENGHENLYEYYTWCE